MYHRPVLSLPPVILMGGDLSSPLHSVMTSSPIVEMPPSPAPSTLMYVEFPEDDFDKIKIDTHNIVEVSTVSFFLLV